MLIETLISIGVLALGLLGVSMMQITALDSSVRAVQRSEAAILLASMSERMRANTDAVYAGKYNGLTRTVLEIEDIRHAEQRAQTDFNRWLIEIDRTMGKGSLPAGNIDCPSATNCILKISWDVRPVYIDGPKAESLIRNTYTQSALF